MTIDEYSDEKLIELHDFSASLIARVINNRCCHNGGKYGPEQQTCWRCDLGRVCRWLNRVDTGTETMHVDALKKSLSCAVKLVQKQLKDEQHYVDCCLCERCIWLRGARNYQTNMKPAVSLRTIYPRGY